MTTYVHPERGGPIVTTRPRIVVGVDGSSRGDDALAFAVALAESIGSGILLSHAYRPGEDRERVDAILESRRAMIGAVPVESVAQADPSPARALHRLAAAWRAGVIVVGPSHRAGLGLMVPGSTGQQLLHGSPCAVAVVPRAWRPAAEAPMRHIGCGYDGSPEAQAALTMASALTRAVGGELEVMRAFWSAPPTGALGIAVAADLEARGQAGLGEAVRALPKEANAHARVLLNDAARALVSRSRDLDVLILGTRGKGPVGAIWAGSVSSRVIREASCPVLVVPRGVVPALIEGPSPTAQSA